MTITYSEALNYVTTHCELPENVTNRLNELKASVEKRNSRHGSEESMKKAAEKKKAENAEKRAEYLSKVGPIIKAAITTTPQTDAEIYAAMKDVPEELTLTKVRYILVHNELGEDIVKVGNGKNPNTYHLKERA